MQKGSSQMILIYFILFIIITFLFILKNNIDKTLVQQDRLASSVIGVINSIVPERL